MLGILLSTMQTSATDRVVGVGVHDAWFWFLMVWFLLLFSLVFFGFPAFFLILDGLIL